MKFFPVMTVILLLVIVLGVIFFLDYQEKSQKTITTLKGEISKHINGYNVYILKEKRIKCMTKTLMVIYGISKWEAHYYSVIFDDFSQEFQIPWEIYPSIVRIESNFKCNLVSPKGAKGLMQILESTGKDVADRLQISYVEQATLWNVILNAVLGCQYLSENIKRTGLVSGVKSYLGGPAFNVSVQKDEEINKYVTEYKTSVWKEYKNLGYIYRGIVSELGENYAELHPISYSDSIQIEIELFSPSDSLTKGAK